MDVIGMINETPTKTLSSICCWMKFRTARKTSSASCCTFTAAPDKTDLASSSSTPPPSSSSPSISSPSPHRNHSHLHHQHDFLLHLRRHHHLTYLHHPQRTFHISTILYSVWGALTLDVLSVQTSEEVLVGGPAGWVSNGPQDPLQMDWHVIQGTLTHRRRIPPWSMGHSSHFLNHMKTYGRVRRWNMHESHPDRDACSIRWSYLSSRNFSSGVAMKDWSRALTQQVSP